MSLRIAVQMDPIERIRVAGDSTFALLLEGERRGHAISYYTPERLAMIDGKVFATVQPLKVRDQERDHFTLGEGKRVELSSFDVVLMRQDPPFDLAYITATHLLERIQQRTLVVNDPAAVRNAPEKLFVLDFAQFMPPTMITRSLDEARSFHAEHGEVVVKPLYGNAGSAVFHVGRKDANLSAL